MAVEKEFILQEIQRCAAENGGVPLGLERFESETGIKPSHMLGRYWVTWSDAVAEAGLQPNVMQQRDLDDNGLLRHLALITRRLGRFPTNSELNLEHHSNSAFPTGKTFRQRLGGKHNQIARLRALVESDDDLADVREILPSEARAEPLRAEKTPPSEPNGFVYLVRSGKHHKIGRSNDPSRRSYEMGLQLPEKHVEVHRIETDDPAGIERYWHERFKDRRKGGEWFLLTTADVAAFKRRRKFM